MSSSTDHDDAQAFDETGDPIAADEREDPRSEPTGPRVGADGREVVVPFRLYKAVTVFSTLAAVVAYLIGFTLIDAATMQISFMRTTIVYLLNSAGLYPSDDALVAALAIGGIAFIVGGTVVYVLGTRFRGQGMGKSQDDSDES
ncbi:DUF7315 family membrane protein [Halorubrum lacusprofundi]|jgi:hypothetical protein|uniref:DUF7315 domain-containing protein n=1 Tax=Halorubrum lacusprofundi (strain ATCC 49239 / DSM 5036 / JCM 8891 / ACAM 34) TaxID=416348 RepID=B9LU94_HALLT|nr:hypothetical protein [Halorubrum lacusprofundi]ACM56251.1 conserved hypothetical protein [Halorubrum lacusprofundi ATCC 49239]MCG1005441.1 hypothetical protein [Halorubrum lacusprofundi]